MRVARALLIFNLLSNSGQRPPVPCVHMLLLAANENPRGMPPAAHQAVVAALAGTGAYPDADGTALKAALSACLGVAPSWLTLGSGSSEILELAAQVCLRAGECALYSQYAFIVYGQAIAHAQARALVVPAQDFAHDLDAMRAAITPTTRLVFVANPNNPTGTFLDGPRLHDFIASVPADVTVLLDEAYTEYLAPIVSIRIVDSLDDAIAHIEKYGSHHTDAIITEDYTNARRFIREVDSASVMVNASTQFADGFEYGLGAEIGISTDKIHARGPVGLEGLTSQKWVVLGNGEVRA